MKLRARWNGDPPVAGEFLRSPNRPRFAYCIKQVDIVRKICHVHYLVLHVERLAAGDVPPVAVVYDWKWDARGPRRR